MSRRENTSFRCRVCRMLGRLCICPLIPNPPLATNTRLVLIMHRAEDHKSTNTGRLAARCLAGSTIVSRGHVGQPSPPLVWSDAVQPILLFPHADALPLHEMVRSLDKRPVVLIVPDGNWRQASKVRRRVPGLTSIACASVTGEARLARRLRAETHAHGLSTLEAIARAMGILEGVHVQEALERVFQSMVERTLWTRGEIATREVTGGVPEGAVQHDPRAGRGFAPGDAGVSEDC